jgi:hypothetical protein
MSLKSHAVRKGLHIVDGFDCADPIGIISAAGTPGGDTGEQDDAGLGMIYVNSTNGDLYRKLSTANNSLADWEIIGTDVGISATGITTNAPVDQIAVDLIKGVEWEVEVEEFDNPENRVFFKLFVGHNGTATADATVVDFTEFAVLCMGAAFDYSYTVVLGGTGAGQDMFLNFASTETNGINVTARRTDLK